MCIIISKGAGVEMPRKSTLEYCWSNNPDGGGFMYASGGAVHYQKGFMTFKAFYKALKKCGDLTAVPLVIHFRISTHGGVTKSNCHPFEVTKDTARLASTHGSCAVAVAHNGIIDMFAHSKGALSDTALFTRGVLSRLCARQSWYKDKALIDIIEYCAGVSRLAILSGNGHCEHIGRWYTDTSGVRYSNSGYKKPAYIASKYSGYAHAYPYDAYSGDHLDRCEECEKRDCGSCDYYHYLMDEMGAYQ